MEGLWAVIIFVPALIVAFALGYAWGRFKDERADPKPCTAYIEQGENGRWRWYAYEAYPVGQKGKNPRGEPLCTGGISGFDTYQKALDDVNYVLSSRGWTPLCKRVDEWSKTNDG